MKTSEIAIIFIVGTLTLLVFVFFIILITIEYRKRQLRHTTEKLELKYRYQQEVLKTQLEVQEQSFRHISEEIHDNIAQTLSLAKIKLYKTADKTTDEKQKANIDLSTELVGNALEGLRNLSHILNGGLVVKMPLRETLEKELKYVADANEIETALTVTGEYREIDDEKKLIAFRMVQEAINNAVKHSKATQISISLVFAIRSLAIVIVDNGSGFNVQGVPVNKGLGLHNMYERAQLLGNMQIVSEPGKGTTITVNINTDE